MIDFNQAISIIRRNGGFKPNRKDTSYYRTYTIEGNRPLQARVSNHGTWLWTWYDKDYDPSYAINFCVVFSENGEYDSDVSVDMDIKDEEGNVIGQKKSFEVIQYIYNCQLLDINDATLINQQVQSIWQNRGFKDPLADTYKHAKVVKLKPNEEPEMIIEKKQLNTYLNMSKKLIRLTENDLHKIIKESVNKILNEVAIKGKSGKTYSLHGTDPESWAVMSRVRGKNGYFPNTPQHYHACRDEDNWIELDDKAHPNLRSRNNANRINAMMNRIDDKSKDIMATNEAHDYWREAEDNYLMREKLPRGWERIEREDDEPIYRDPDFNEYVKNEYGRFVPLNNEF